MSESVDPTPSGQGKSEASAPYELVPSDDVPMARPASASNEPKGKLDAPGLISDFDDDADFTKDPEVEARLSGRSTASPDASGTNKPRRGLHLPGVPGVDAVPLVREGLVDVKWGAIVGWALVLGGGVAAAITTTGPWYAGLLATVLGCVLHTITGLGALGVAGYFLERPIGRVDLAATRVLAAVGAFALLFNINTTVLGHFDESALAMAAYLGVVILFFRVHGGETLLIGVSHALLWGFVAAANWVSSWAATPLPPTTTIGGG